MALKVAYMDTDFQAEVHRLRASHPGDELRFLTSLGPLAAKVQAPVFEQFGLPPGQRGVILMKMGVRLLSMVAPDIKDLAGDLRELLLLPREEEDISSTIKKAESESWRLPWHDSIPKKGNSGTGTITDCSTVGHCRVEIQNDISSCHWHILPYKSYNILIDSETWMKIDPQHTSSSFSPWPQGIPKFATKNRGSALGCARPPG